MVVAMVGIREMPVLMTELRVRVPMRVRPGRNVLAIVVIMVLVMLVSMLVLDHVMFVVVQVTLGDVQPHAPPHERTGNHECDREGLIEKDDCHQRAHKRRYREIR